MASLLCLFGVVIPWRFLVLCLGIILSFLGSGQVVGSFMNQRSLRKEKDWLKLQEDKVENWDEFGTEWKARGLPYPWGSVDLKNEWERTATAISGCEKRNELKQFVIGLTTTVLAITICVLTYLFL